MGLSWFTGLFNIFFWLFISNAVGMIICTAVYTCAVLIIVINAEFSVRKAQETLTESSGKGSYADSDEHWIIGMFYCNPNDSHTMINARFGLGMTVNLAKPAGKILTVIALVSIIAMPFIGAIIIPEEFTPVRVELDGASIKAYHTSLAYEVALLDIREAKLLDELPRSRKIVGTGFDALLKGRFMVNDIGMSLLCLNPAVSPFILIITDEATYIFGTSDASYNRALYDAMSSTG